MNKGFLRTAVMICALSLLLFKTADGLAAPLTLEGKFTQGGLVFGVSDPNAQISLDGKALRVSKEGLFIFGFDRDAKKTATLEVVTPDGKKDIRKLEISPREFDIQRINGLPSKKVTPDPEALERIKRDNGRIGQARQRDTAIPYFGSGFGWPVDGRISGVFGSQRILNGEPRSPHKGLDIAAPIGTEIKASADGVISLVDQDMYLMGKAIMIDHGHGLQSVYIHMNKITVKEGQVVKKGDPVGEVGQSGRATGPHLHWGVSWYNVALDPKLLLE